MTKKTTKLTGTIIGCIGAILAFLTVCALSWIINCGIVYLICVCFGWPFSWGMATGVWLIMCLARTVFRNAITVKK